MQAGYEVEDESVRQALRGQAGPGHSEAQHVGCEQLCRSLQRSQQKLDAEHQVATATWGAPLSLFSESAHQRATESGVHDWAILTVMKARRLVEEAAVLGDLTEVYKAQILTAQREKRKVLREPLLRHLERLDGLAEELQAHQPYLRAAKDAFSGPKADARETGLPSSPSVKNPTHEKESPVVIIQPRSRPQMFGSLGAKPKEYMIRFLESAIDFVGAAATATGMNADVQSTEAEDAAETAEAAPASTENALPVLETAAGTISHWLDVKEAIEESHSPREVDWSSAQLLWQKCRRRSDRRWTLA